MGTRGCLQGRGKCRERCTCEIGLRWMLAAHSGKQIPNALICGAAGVCVCVYGRVLMVVKPDVLQIFRIWLKSVKEFLGYPWECSNEHVQLLMSQANFLEFTSGSVHNRTRTTTHICVQVTEIEQIIFVNMHRQAQVFHI